MGVARRFWSRSSALRVSLHFRGDHRRVMMYSVLVVLLFVSIYSDEIQSNVMTTTNNFHESMLLKKTESHLSEKEKVPRINLVTKQSKSSKTDESKNIPSGSLDSNVVPSKRKAKLLGSLAFLAGLSVGGLSTAASSTMKSWAKLPKASVTLNLGSSKLGPYLAAFYDPYPFLSHPYFYHGYLGSYPLVDPTKLQSSNDGSVQSAFQQDQLTPQILTLLDNKKPIDLSNNEDDYIEEKKKRPETEITSNDNKDDDVDDQEKLQTKDAEEKITATSQTDACGVASKALQEKASYNSFIQDRDFVDLEGSADEESNVSTRPRPFRRRQGNTTVAQQPIPTNAMNVTNATVTTPKPVVTTQNSTSYPINQTTYPYFFGYYGGNPNQNAGQVDITTYPSNVYRYHDYNPINYNLPHADKPTNFYHDSFYANPPAPGAFAPGQFLQEQIPADYLGNDYSRLIYASENSSPYANGFQPVL